MTFKEMDAELKKIKKSFFEEGDRIYDEYYSAKPIEFDKYKIKDHKNVIKFLNRFINLLEQGDDSIQEQCKKIIELRRKEITRYEKMIKMYEERIKEYQLKEQYNDDENIY